MSASREARNFCTTSLWPMRLRKLLFSHRIYVTYTLRFWSRRMTESRRSVAQRFEICHNVPVLIDTYYPTKKIEETSELNGTVSNSRMREWNFFVTFLANVAFLFAQHVMSLHNLHVDDVIKKLLSPGLVIRWMCVCVFVCLLLNREQQVEWYRQIVPHKM